MATPKTPFSGLPKRVTKNIWNSMFWSETIHFTFYYNRLPITASEFEKNSTRTNRTTTLFISAKLNKYLIIFFTKQIIIGTVRTVGLPDQKNEIKVTDCILGNFKKKSGRPWPLNCRPGHQS
jgi:hypothetical protein